MINVNTIVSNTRSPDDQREPPKGKFCRGKQQLEPLAHPFHWSPPPSSVQCQAAMPATRCKMKTLPYTNQQDELKLNHPTLTWGFASATAKIKDAPIWEHATLTRSISAPFVWLVTWTGEVIGGGGDIAIRNIYAHNLPVHRNGQPYPACLLEIRKIQVLLGPEKGTAHNTQTRTNNLNQPILPKHSPRPFFCFFVSKGK